jgi:hypothetical protein
MLLLIIKLFVVKKTSNQLGHSLPTSISLAKSASLWWRRSLPLFCSVVPRLTSSLERRVSPLLVLVDRPRHLGPSQQEARSPHCLLEVSTPVCCGLGTWWLAAWRSEPERPHVRGLGVGHAKRAKEAKPSVECCSSFSNFQSSLFAVMSYVLSCCILGKLLSIKYLFIISSHFSW